MLAFHSDHFTLELPPGHSFPMSKYRLLREAVERELPAIRVHEAQPASDGELALVHSPVYVTRRRRRAAVAGAAARDRLPMVATHGRACAAFGRRHHRRRACRADRRRWRANLAGGTHHAYPDRGSGYCVFNDVAVAARLMQAEWHRAQRRLLRVLVIDLDVHQGNGTAAIFRDDPTVFTLSRAWREELSVRARKPATWTSNCPMAAAMPTTCKRWTRRWTRPGAGMSTACPAWPSTSPVPTRTRAIGWAG